eukprot:TRINITY_DN23_c0_g1_i1.p1 TRINITY_DN23_c0_g1~~TRINITY_DN23_c0_g1_i1.p1  ORF type:complete len:396 (-),score=121.95 TRINITY_DN23_c0_g1_i1:229-1416(-)
MCIRDRYQRRVRDSLSNAMDRKCGVLLLLCLSAFTLGKEVHELGEGAKSMPEAGPNGAFNSQTNMDTWGRETGNVKLNMVGAPHGLPGYKESHNWETDIDIWAPAVFNWQFYRAMYSDSVGEKTEGDTRKDWLQVANADDVKYPNCRQASDQFSMNMYYRANPGLAATTKGVCHEILKDYLSTGIYDGKPTYLASAEKTYKNSLGADALAKYNESPQGKARARSLRSSDNLEWPIDRTKGNLGQVVDAQKFYSYSFWFKQIYTVETRGNILLYGTNSPKISTAPNHGKYLEVISAQTNSDQWGCNTPDTEEFRLKQKQWTHVAVVAEDKKLSVYLNGKKAVSCENTAGEMSILSEKTLFVPNNEDAADGMIKNLKYWAGSPLNQELIQVEYAQGA